jgi:hypothetical protein
MSTHDYSHMMVFTVTPGGIMKCWWANREMFEEAKRTGKLNTTPHQDRETVVDLAMVALCEVVELHDFRKPS